jgi:phage baseplate assembly protein V
VRLIGDGGSRQSAQLEVTKGELLDDVPRMQNYGMTSVPPVGGSDATVIFLGGDRNEPIIVAMENRQFRLTNLESGEVAIYDDLGNVFKLGRDQVEVTAVTKLVVTAPEVDLVVGASSVSVTSGAIALVSAVLTHNGKNIGATHYHVGSPSTAVPV